MRILITGANGMLGHDLVAALDGREVTALGRADLDITDAAAVASAVRGHDFVINSAAYTKVDDAETDEAAATLINGTAVGYLAAAADREGATLVQVSTDYVFDGTATTPYPENTVLAPVSAYGRSKAVGERLLASSGANHYLVRTAWLYGEHGPNFPKTMLRLARTNPTLTVVDDQVGQPTWTRDLAAQIVTLIDADAPLGTYHATNSGSASWFDFARAVFANAGLDAERVQPVDSSRFVRPAPRPAYSVLGHAAWERAGIAPMRDWSMAIRDAQSAGVVGPE